MATTHTGSARPSTALTGVARGVAVGAETWDGSTETWNESASLVDPDLTWDDSSGVIITQHTAEARP